MSIRSYLFVPGTKLEFITKAYDSGAGAVIVDLEDAVACQDKEAARNNLHHYFEMGNAYPVYMRINSYGTPWYEEDVLFCKSSKVLGIVIPKAEDATNLNSLHQFLPDKPLLPLIETASGFNQVFQIAKVPKVQRLLFGTIDFQKDLGISGDVDSLLYFKSHLVLVSRLANLLPPVDGVTTDIVDIQKISQDAKRSFSLGFGGKLCIHPRQVEPVESAFLPSAADIEWAQEVLKVASQSQGAAVALKGQMIDKPIIQRAQSILEKVIN